jgi:hypothetical protein
MLLNHNFSYYESSDEKSIYFVEVGGCNAGLLAALFVIIINNDLSAQDKVRSERQALDLHV